jgi:hypothetical protein
VRAARVQKAEECINRFPYRYEAIDDAFKRFLEDGTLPEDRAIAGRVLQRVLDARKKVPQIEAERLALGLDQPCGTTREMLFREACCTDKVIREFARMLLSAMVRAGYDPTDPDLIGPEMEPWLFAPVCLRLMGWPQDFVRPQYQKQLARLLEQQAAERAARPRNDDEWDREAGKALSAFMARGVVPADSRYFAFVMGIAGSFALAGHYFGKLGDRVEDLLAAFDAIATGSPEERAAALQRIGPLQVATRQWHDDDES